MTDWARIIAVLDERIAAMEAASAQHRVARDGRGDAWAAARQAAAASDRVADRLMVDKNQRNWTGRARVGPWVELTCPRGHTITPARLLVRGDGAVDLQLGRTSRARVVDAELRPGTAPDGVSESIGWFIGESAAPAPTDRLAARCQWTCGLASCPWPGATLRPEHVLQVYTAAVEIGIGRVPIVLPKRGRRT